MFVNTRSVTRYLCRGGSRKNLVEANVYLQQLHVTGILTNAEWSVHLWYHLRHKSIDLYVVEHEVTAIGTHTVVVHLHPVSLELLGGREFQIELLPYHLVGSIAAIGTSAVVQLIALSRTEAVDGLSITAFQRLALYRQGDAARAAIRAIVTISVRTSNPTGTHQFVTFTELSLEVHGTDITRLFRGIDIKEAFLHAFISGNIIACSFMVGWISHLIITPFRALLCHHGVCRPVTAITIEGIVGVVKGQRQWTGVGYRAIRLLIYIMMQRYS